MEHIVFEVGLALTLIAAAALLSARLRFSVVPFLILAGMVVGPHMPKLGIIANRVTTLFTSVGNEADRVGAT